MANTITKTTLLDGTRDIIIKVDIISDNSGDETGAVIFDASAFTNTTYDKKVIQVQYCLNGFSGSLYWKATSDTHFLTMETDHYSDFEFRQGLNNIGLSGANGDILLNTIGLGSNDNGYIILHIQNKGN